MYCMRYDAIRCDQFNERADTVADIRFVTFAIIRDMNVSS